MAEYHLVNADGEEWHGFKSRLATWKYVPQCKMCREELANGYVAYGQDDEAHRYPVTHPASTACGCEYIVLSDKEYKEYHDPPFTCWEHKDRVMSRYWAKKKRSRNPRR